uniref:Protein Lines C-terminal domain-containing protein n=1 Tax=Oryza glumipatula TaxID=40148 RepID=A0A0E0AFA8_9ORYZ
MARRRRERRQLARLCDLVAGALLPHLEPKPPATRLTREDERRILLALSRVNKAIRGWEEEEEEEEEEDDDEGCELDQEIISCSAEVHSCSLPANQHIDDGFSCLANIISILVGFFGFCSSYVKHSAGNILIVISDSLMKFEVVWIQFVELVWIAIHTVSTCAHSALPSLIDSISSFRKDSICYCSVMESLSHDIIISSTNITSFVEVLQLRCLDINGHMVASLFRVLHTILKFLKHTDNELKEDFICISAHHILMVDWDLYYQLNVGEPLNLVKDSTFSLSDDLKQLGFLSSSLLQLLCSLLEQSDLEDNNGQDIYAKLVGVIPKLVAILPEHQDAPKSLSQYLKHKFLMIMMRLKPYIQKDCSYIVCCLKLLRQHFQDLLHEPIMQHIAKPENCLEGSPFLLSTVGLGETHDKSTRHLQRQAMYLFLSFCICLAHNGNDSALQCSCKRDDQMLGHKVLDCSDHCDCFALSEISDWFQRCFLDKIFGFKSSTDNALCFLQLYMEEDDMLFNVLLQLLDAPLISSKIDSMENRWASELIGGKLFSSIFDPVHLHYDHLVLVDYLISKDVGVHCAQYLLRCLRLVTQCWHSFTDDSIYEAKIEKLNFKRQKTFNDANSSSGSSIEGPKLGSACHKKSKNKHKLFLNAKACLLSLKRTLEDLHRKGLFPYNPKPLLKSLARFEELCEQD